jgi:hypothetical protein
LAASRKKTELTSKVIAKIILKLIAPAHEGEFHEPV